MQTGIAADHAPADQGDERGVLLGILAGQGHHDQHGQCADHADRREDAEHPAALVVVGGQDRAPGGVRQVGHRTAQVHDQQPGHEVDVADPLGRHEQHEDAEHQDRSAGQHPDAVAADPRSRAVP